MQLLRDERTRRQSRQRVQFQKVHAIRTRDQIAARVTFAAEGDVRGERHRLRFMAHRLRDLRGTDLARSFAEVLAFVVEGRAGIGFDLDDRQRKGTVAAFDDADRQFASSDELLDDIRNVVDGRNRASQFDEKQSARRSAGKRFEDELLVTLQHLGDRLIDRADVLHHARFRDPHAILHDLLGAAFVERGRARGRAGAGERDCARFHHSLHGAVLPFSAVEREEENGIIDRQRIERHLQIGPDGRPRRLEIVDERIRMHQQFVAIDVVHRAIRRPEPRQRRAERAHDVLRRGNGHMAFIATPAKENDHSHCLSPRLRASA